MSESMQLLKIIAGLARVKPTAITVTNIVGGISYYKLSLAPETLNRKAIRL